jgi:hypothetical protein
MAPVKVFAPPIVWAVVRSTKFCVDEPVPPLAIATMPVTFAAVPVTDPEIGLVTVRSLKVPTLVKLLVTTVGFNVVPVRVAASAVTIMFELPSKEIPLIVLAVSKAVAVAALPVISPVTLPITSPVKSAVMVPASKLPPASLKTIVFALFDDVAVVAVFDTFPAVTIVASLVSIIPAVELISALIISLSRIFALVTDPSSSSFACIALLLRVTTPVAIRFVTVAAAAVVDPMTALSIVPPLISAVLTIKPLAAVISNASLPEIITLLPPLVRRLFPLM